MSKVIAIMDRPKNCEECVFGVCKYSLPLTTRSKGYYCNLQKPENRTVEDFAYEAEVHLQNCPLREVPKKTDFRKAKTETVMNWIEGYNACIDNIMKGSEENEID